MFVRGVQRCTGLIFLVLGCSPEPERVGVVLPGHVGHADMNVLFVEDCSERPRAWVLPKDHGPLEISSECESTTTYYAAYFGEALEVLGLAPGPLALSPCDPEAGKSCVDAPLPRPKSGGLYASTLDPDGVFSGWNISVEGWSSAVEALRYQRRTGCRRSVSKGFTLPGHHSPRAVSLDEERVAIVAHHPYPSGTRTEYLSVFVLSLDELRANGPPAEPVTRIDAHQLGRVASDLRTGELFAAIREDHVLRGRPSEGLVMDRFGDAGDGLRSIEQIAIRTRAEGEPAVAMVDSGRPGVVIVARDRQLQISDATMHMSGTCGNGTRGQFNALMWTSDDEVIAMPRHSIYNSDGVITTTTAPDGYWHLAGGEMAWRRIPRPDADTDCVRGLASIPSTGLVAVTAAGRTLVERESGWEELEFPELPLSSLIDVGGPLLVPIGRGFAMVRGDTRVVNVSGGVVCEDVPAISSKISDMIAHDDSLLVLSTGLATSPPSVDIYLIDFVDP